MGSKKVLPLRIRVGLGVMSMKGYSTLPIQNLGITIRCSLISYPGHLFIYSERIQSLYPKPHLAKSARAVEYANYISAEG